MAKEKLPPKKIDKDESEEDEETPTASTTETPFVVFPTKARAPEESRTPSTSPLPRPRTAALEDLPPPVVPLIPPKIITADYGAPPRDADDEKKAKVSSLKVFKTVSGKPKESIYETKHSNLYALDKDYLLELIETKEKYQKLMKEEEDEKLKKEKEAKEKLKEEREREERKAEREKEEQKAKAVARAQDNHRQKSYWNCMVRGRCKADSLSESERYGPNDPMKYTLKRVKQLKKYQEAADKASRAEMEVANVLFGSKRVLPEIFPGYDGQRWMTMCPPYAQIKPHAMRTQVTLVNFTNKTMEVKLRTNGNSCNWKFLGLPQIVLPHSYQDVEVHYLKKKPTDTPLETLVLFYNVLEDMEAIRREFDPEKITLSKYYAGRMTINLFNFNYQANFYQRRNDFDKDVKAARKRAIRYALESTDYDDDDAGGSTGRDQEKAAEKIQGSPATKEKEQRKKEKKVEKKLKKEQKKNKKKVEQKQPPPSSQVSATQNTSVEICDVTASKDVTDDRNVKKYGDKK